MERSKKLPLGLRWWGILTGAVTLFWLPVEDTRTIFLVLLVGMWGIWLAGWLWTRLPEGWSAIWRGVAAGAFGGGLFFPLFAALTVFKAGIHHHGFLDFSNFAMGRVWSAAPFVGIGGAVLGGLVGIFWKNRGKNPIFGENV